MNMPYITSPSPIARRFSVDAADIRRVAATYPMKITPHYFSLIQAPGDGLWKQAVPDLRELEDTALEDDPLHEERQSPTPNLIHRYPDRVVFLVSDQCAMYCRYCMRKRRTGKLFSVDEASLEKGIAYIHGHKQIRDVILSGGDPLMRDDDTLDSLLHQVRSIPAC